MVFYVLVEWFLCLLDIFIVWCELLVIGVVLLVGILVGVILVEKVFCNSFVDGLVLRN